jgi:peptide/nickel transport system permease protein
VSTPVSAMPVPTLSEAADTVPPTSAPGLRGRGRSHLGVWVAALFLALVTVLALGADLLPLTDPNSTSPNTNQGPGLRWDEPLGTDNLGRSLLSRVIHGGRVSLAVTLGAISFSVVVGTLLGLAGGFFRRAIDTILDVLLTSMLAFPPLIFLIAVTTILEPSVGSLIFSLGLLGVPLVARVARANTIAVGSREYVTAARAAGMTSPRIMLREVLPNILPSVLSFALVVAAALIVAEGSLSFLGLGIRPPNPSWGVMISNSVSRLQEQSYQMLVPATVFFLTVLSLNTLGNFARARVEGRSS